MRADREDVARRVGAAMREARDHAGLTQAEAAEQLGESRDTVAKWDQGRHIPDLWKFPHIERVYGLPRGWLLRHAGFLEDVARWNLADIVSSDPSIESDVAELVAALVARITGTSRSA